MHISKLSKEQVLHVLKVAAYAGVSALIAAVPALLASNPALLAFAPAINVLLVAVQKLFEDPEPIAKSGV